MGKESDFFACQFAKEHKQRCLLFVLLFIERYFILNTNSDRKKRWIFVFHNITLFLLYKRMEVKSDS